MQDPLAPRYKIATTAEIARRRVALDAIPRIGEPTAAGIVATATRLGVDADQMLLLYSIAD